MNDQAILCHECDQPMLPKGEKRKHPSDYRHASGCPKASKSERQRWGKLIDDSHR